MMSSRKPYKLGWTLLVPISLLIASCSINSYGAGHQEAVPKFSAESLQSHVAVLASDEFEGRGAGYAGEALAADYIAHQLMLAELEPAISVDGKAIEYLQRFDMHALDGPTPWQKLASQNVVAILPGRDPAAGYIVVGAHYDGQGMQGQAALGRSISEGDEDYIVAEGDVIWNSAVDNAVSIAAIIEIAKTMSDAELQARRSIIFVAFGAEESALDGSTYYANHPVGGRAAISAMVNLEKIIGDADAEFLYVSYGTSSVFQDITTQGVAETGIDLLPFYPGVIANTDHYAFIMSGIPAITIGTGSAENVHTPSDHADGLDYDLLAARTGFIAEYILRLANSDDGFEFTGDISGHYGASGAPATEAERLERQFTGKTSFKIASVVEGALADQAGLEPGDLVIAVNDGPIPPQTYYLGLEDIFDEEMVCSDITLTVVRGSQTLELNLAAAC